MTASIWRYASAPPKAAGIPCIAYLPLFGWMFHMRWWTFYTAVASILLYAILARHGITFRVLWDRSLHVLRGSRIYARPWWYRRRFEETL